MGAAGEPPARLVYFVAAPPPAAKINMSDEQPPAEEQENRPLAAGGPPADFRLGVDPPLLGGGSDMASFSNCDGAVTSFAVWVSWIERLCQTFMGEGKRFQILFS